MVWKLIGLFCLALLFFPAGFCFNFFGLLSPQTVLVVPADLNGEDLNVGVVLAKTVDANAVFANFFVARNYIDANFLMNANVNGDLNVSGHFNSPDLNANFVPYIGATKDVNLNFYDINVRIIKALDGNIARNLNVTGIGSVSGLNVGTATEAAANQLAVAGSTYPVASIYRTTTTVSNDVLNVILYGAKTSLDMTDGYGPAQTYQIQDSDGAWNVIGQLAIVRDSGVDNRGTFKVRLGRSGGYNDVITADSIGDTNFRRDLNLGRNLIVENNVKIKKDLNVVRNLGVDGNIMITANYTPAASTGSCAKGTIAYDTTYIYICVATNTWYRGSIGTW